jgi:hypothetical protein
LCWVGDREVDAPDVVVVGDSGAGWESALGEVAVPLGDGGVRFVGEVEAANHVAALPAAVGGLSAAAEQVRVMWRVADPFAGDGDGIDVEVLGHRRVRRVEISESGMVGDATRAKLETGLAIADAVIPRMVQVVRDMRETGGPPTPPRTQRDTSPAAD